MAESGVYDGPRHEQSDRWRATYPACHLCSRAQPVHTALDAPPAADRMSKNFRDLSEAEILALAISLEEEDSRIYGEFADGLRDRYPTSAQMFDEMQKEETSHHTRLLDIYRQRFGSHIPLIRRQDVKGFVERRPVWRMRPLGIETVRKQAETMELETRRFYERAMERIGDVSVRQLIGELAATERKHYAIATTLE